MHIALDILIILSNHTLLILRDMLGNCNFHHNLLFWVRFIFQRSIFWS